MVLALNDRLRQDISDINEQKKGRVVLGISHARATFFLPYVLPEFQRQYPGIEVKTVEIRSDKIEEYVSKGKCDIGILPLPLSGAYALEQEIICREELFWVSGETLALAVKAVCDKSHVILMEHHGVLVYDTKLSECRTGLEVTENICKMNILAGCGNLPLEEVAPETVKDFLEGGYFKARRK